MGIPAASSVEVRNPWDVISAKLLAERVASDQGFSSLERDEIAIVVSEIGTNLVKHAGGGVISVTSLFADGHKGIKIESMDNGPGIADIDKAMADGFSSVNSRGNGLGAVNRLMDRLEVVSPVDGDCGTRLSCIRWVRQDVRGCALPCPFEIGVATRTHPLEKVNGDAFLIKHGEASVTIAVIDGLGHGEHAHRAAWAARAYVELHHDQPLDAIFRGAGFACRGTRGVVMAMVRFAWVAGPVEGPGIIRFIHASVGNIETKVFGGQHPVQFVVRRGVVGANAPEPVVSSHSWDPDMVLVMHSDGLRTDWRWTDCRECDGVDINQAAAALLRRFGREDDVTVVVVRTKDYRGGRHE